MRPSSFQSAIRSRVCCSSSSRPLGSSASSSSAQLLDLVLGHLGVELDAPRAVAEPEGLSADLAPGQLHPAGGDGVGVVVPLEALEPLRESAEHGVVARFIRQLDRMPADLGLGGRPDVGMRRLRDQLRAETNTEHRYLEAEESLKQEVLLAQPGMVLVVVGVHRASEDEHGAVVVQRPRRRRAPGEAPLLELVAALRDRICEHPSPDVLPMDHGQDVHGSTFELTRTVGL